MTETRYWKRVGLRMTREQMLDVAERMTLKASYLDEDLEEFTEVDGNSRSAVKEIEALFAAPDAYEDGDPVDPETEVINLAFAYHQNRKAILLEIREAVEKEMTDSRDEALAELMSDRGLERDEAEMVWANELKPAVRAEADIRWQEHFDEYVIGLRKERGLSTPEQ